MAEQSRFGPPMRPVRWLAILAGAYALGVEIAGPVGAVLHRWDRRRCPRG